MPNRGELVNIATLARAKLQSAADEPDHCLRRLCGHANTLDALLESMERLQDSSVAISSALDGVLAGLDESSDEEDGADTADHILPTPLHVVAGLPDAGASLTPEGLSVHDEPRHTPERGHAYEVAAGCSAGKFEPTLEVIEETLSGCEQPNGSGDDEDVTGCSEAQSPGLVPAQPTASDGCELLSIVPLLLEPQFGFELERVASRSSLAAAAS